MLVLVAAGQATADCGGHYINRWNPRGEMAESSECIASSVFADQETLEQIRLEESEFYGDHLSEDDNTTTTNDSDEEELSLSEDEVSTRQEIRSMSTFRITCSYRIW